jgi:hypothetical protein
VRVPFAEINQATLGLSSDRPLRRRWMRPVVVTRSFIAAIRTSCDANYDSGICHGPEKLSTRFNRRRQELPVPADLRNQASVERNGFPNTFGAAKDRRHAV